MAIDILTAKVREGGKDEYTRFQSLSSVIGYWLRRYHEGIITEEQTREEYVADNVQYQCGDCGMSISLKASEPIRCSNCGYRILYKPRTKRIVQCEAR